MENDNLYYYIYSYGLCKCAWTAIAYAVNSWTWNIDEVTSKRFIEH